MDIDFSVSVPASARMGPVAHATTETVRRFKGRHSSVSIINLASALLSKWTSSYLVLANLRLVCRSDACDGDRTAFRKGRGQGGGDTHDSDRDEGCWSSDALQPEWRLVHSGRLGICFDGMWVLWDRRLTEFLSVFPSFLNLLSEKKNYNLSKCHGRLPFNDSFNHWFNDSST